jgi:hypothetical protein
MSNPKTLLAALRDVQSQPEIRTGRVSFKLNPLQTLEAKSRLRAIVKAVKAEAGDDAKLPSSDELFLAMMAQVQPTGDESNGGPEIEQYLEEFFHPSGAASSSDSPDGGVRRARRKKKRA